MVFSIILDTPGNSEMGLLFSGSLLEPFLIETLVLQS